MTDYAVEKMNNQILKANLKLLDENKVLKEDKEILKRRIDKAIEYLESYNRDFKHCKFGEAPISMRELGDLLDILKGDYIYE